MTHPHDRPRLGFIGLGVMGSPMAGHLVEAGFPLCVFDIDRTAAERLQARHADLTVADCPATIGMTADIVITMLPDGHEVQRAVLGPDGLAETLGAGSLLLDTSSAQPWLTLETAGALAERGVGMIDAPVSGAQWGAEQAELVFMVGGNSEEIERVRPILDVLGRAVFHIGPLGCGHIMKCINNTITAMTLLATAEGLVLGKRAGLDPVAINAVLNESTGGSWISRNHIEQRILSRTFDDPFKLELMVKDVGIAMQLARDSALTLPYVELCYRFYEAANAHAGSGESLSELVRWVEHRTEVDITPGSEDLQHRI